MRWLVVPVPASPRPVPRVGADRPTPVCDDPQVPAAPAAAELLEPPGVGRIFEAGRAVRLGDVDRRGRLRCDATARFLQDVATDDADDAGLDRRYGWLVRRTLVDVARPPSLGEQLALATWCTGTGRSWAERRTRLTGVKGGRVDAVSLWVQIDVATGRPAPIADDFTSAYAEAANGRRVSARLALPAPPDSTASMERASWPIRRTDLDPFDHVNNAATWSALEEAAALDETERLGRAEIEYLAPITRGDHVVLLGDTEQGAARGGSDPDPSRVPGRATAWLTVDGVVHAALRWTPGR